MFSTKVYSIAVALAASTLLTACTSDDARSFDSESTSRPFGNVDGAGNNGAPVGIEGTWVQGCVAEDPADADTEYATAVAIFTTDTAIVTHNAYTDNGCSVAANPAEFSVDYSLEFPGETTFTSLGDAAHVNVTLESATVDGQPVSDGFSALIGLSDTQFDLLLIANNRLYFGDTDGDLNGTSEATRPVSLDARLVYTRQ